MPRRDDIQKVMIIGSGPIVIGQARIAAARQGGGGVTSLQEYDGNMAR